MLTPPLIVMGVSGCGKSTLARALATQLDYPFIEGDDCHPPGNVAKMTAGIPLDDEDRRPFLEKVAAAINSAPDCRAVASCSALKRSYRDLLRSRCKGAIFVLPHLTREHLLQRLLQRAHFMPASLLDSQLATLEPPSSDECAIVLDGTLPTPRLVSELRRHLTVLLADREVR